MLALSAVTEIQPKDIDAREKQVAQLVGRGARRADRGDDLCMTHADLKFSTRVARIEKIYQDIKMVAKHGGFRKGAGRPKGSRNRATIAREARQREALAVARAEDASLMPIDFLLRVLRDPTTPLGRRTAVAKFLARYLPPRRNGLREK